MCGEPLELHFQQFFRIAAKELALVTRCKLKFFYGFDGRRNWP
jgi:hypothetical protein